MTVTGTLDIGYPVGAESGNDLRDGAAKATVVSRSGRPTAGEHLSVTALAHFIDGGDEPESPHFWRTRGERRPDRITAAASL